MKTPILFLAALPLIALSSCSAVKETAAQVKENTLGSREPKLHLTKADPSRFLPEGTSAEKVLSKTTPRQAPKKDTRLLAKNTLPKKKSTPSRASSRTPVRTKTVKTVKTVKAKAPKKVEPEVEHYELPPLPTHTSGDNQGPQGILPSLDGSDEATFIDVDGKPLVLPPMEMPEPDEESNTEGSA